MLRSGSPGGGALAALLGRSPSTRIVWGLERTERMLAELGEPHRAFRSLLVGGTNGKGSAAAMSEALLRAHGCRTGLYTSPHLREPAERIRIDGGPVDPALLERCAREVLPGAERADASFFESLTVTAFLAFARSGVETAVVEVGLGGRLDATNVLAPDACAITNVALDHADWLGGSLEQIASEKAGIIREGVPLVTGQLESTAEQVVDSRARERAAPRQVLGRDFRVESPETGAGGTRFRYRAPRTPHLDGMTVAIPLPGLHQAGNAAIALTLTAAAGHPLEPARSAEALAGLRWPGRFQLLRQGSATIVLDVAHNPAGVEALADTLDRVELPGPRIGLIGILGDKPWREMLGPLLDRLDGAVFTLPPSAPAARAWDPEAAHAAVPGHRVEVIPRFPEALSRARELAGTGTVLVTGSNHTVGDALRILDPPSDLG